MTAWIFADAGSTTLAAAITTTPTPGTTETWSLTSTTGSPPLPQPTSGQRYGVTVLPPGGDANPEVVVVTEVLNGTQVVVLRGMGTNGVVKTHSIGDTFSNTIPAGFLNGAAQALVVTQQAGATYTFALADEGTVVESTYATSATFTIPLNSTVGFGVPTEITALDGPGSGVLTVTGAAGVTLNGVSGGSVATTGAYQAITLIQAAANVWVGVTSSTAAQTNASSSIRATTGAPTVLSTDQNGDFAYDAIANVMYGPFASGTWPAQGLLLHKQFEPPDFGAAGWTVSPFSGLVAVTGYSAVLVLNRFRTYAAGAVNHIDYNVMVAGATLTNSYFGIWDTGQSNNAQATLLATSADQSTPAASIGVKTAALTSPAILVAGQDYFAGCCFNGVTIPQLAGIVSGSSLQPFMPGSMAATSLLLPLAQIYLSNTVLGNIPLAKFITLPGGTSGNGMYSAQYAMWIRA
jgi:hypothetical protein